MSEERPPLSDDDLEREADRILAAVEGILDRNQRSYAISCKFRRMPADSTWNPPAVSPCPSNS